VICCRRDLPTDVQHLTCHEPGLIRTFVSRIINAFSELNQRTLPSMEEKRVRTVLNRAEVSKDALLPRAVTITYKQFQDQSFGVTWTQCIQGLMKKHENIYCLGKTANCLFKTNPPAVRSGEEVETSTQPA